VKAGPGDRIWKGEEAAAAVFAALAPSAATVKAMRMNKLGATDQEAVERYVRDIVSGAKAVSAFDGALMKNVNSSAGKFGAKGLTVCNRVCEVRR